MKRIISEILSVLLVISLVLGAAACDKGNNSQKTPSQTSSVSSSEISGDNSSATSDTDASSEENFVYDATTVEETVVVDNVRLIKTYENKWGVYEMLKSYTNRASKVSVDDFLPCVGYMHMGKITDTMFDTFVFLPSPTEEIGIEMDQNYISDYINNSLYRDDFNINALEKATEQVKNALGKPNYKVNVFLPLFRPLETVTNFGTYNGKAVNCSTESGRLEALKWFIDEHIRVFKSKNFKNLNLVGFYWFDEYATKENYALIQQMNDYVHSKNYITVWSPFYTAGGYSDWKLMKFDIATMQSNYFPANPDGLNAGGIDRLTTNAQLTELKGMGMEMEASDFNTNAGIRGFKETMQSMLANGRIDFVHMYYIDNGPICVNEWYNNKTKYGQSVYHELHRFIKRTLKDDDIMF